MHGLRMRPSRASVPAPVADTQSKHLREARPHPFPLAAAASWLGPLPEFSKT